MRHISGSVTWNVVNLVRHEGGDPAVRRMLYAAGLSDRLAHFEDDNSWSSFDETRTLFEAAVAELGDERALRRVGAAIARADMTSEVVALLRSLGTPGEVLRHIDQVVPKFCTVVRMEAVEIGSGFAVLSAVNLDGFPRYPQLCDFTAGLLEQAPIPFDLPPALVMEEACSSQGADRCLFRVMWEDDAVLSHDAGVESLTAELAVLNHRFETFQDTAADLVYLDDMPSLLARITARAGLSVRAPRHVLAVRPTPSSKLLIHAEGCTDEEAERLAAEIDVPEPDDRGGSRLIVDVASVHRVYGRLAAVYDEGITFFPAERDLLAAYARLAAAALDGATALAEARRRTATAQVLLGLARELAAVGDEDEIAHRLTASIPAVVGCDMAAVALFDPAESTMRVAAMTGLAPEAEAALKDVVIRPEDTPVMGEMLSNPRPVFFDHAMGDPFIEGLLAIANAPAAAVVPIYRTDEFIGLVGAAFDSSASALEEDRELVERLEGLADLAATAFHNARLIEHIKHQAHFDTLTGLPNKRLLEQRVGSALERRHSPLAVLFVDLDRFKNVNDSLGHELGDVLLTQVSERLSSVVRDEDTLARLGGDEFALLLADVHDRDVAAAVASRVHSVLQAPFEVDGHRLFVTASVGVAVSPDDGEDCASLLKKADMAMYRAKDQGRNRYAFYRTGLDKDLSSRLRLESDLHQAIERDELLVRYQPQVDLETMRVVGVEALVRWQHHELGLVSPENFIPLAEETGLIVDIDRWVLRESCRQAKEWADEGLDIRVAVNLSDRDLRDHEFIAAVPDVLAEFGLPADRLELEVTEHVVDSGEADLYDVLEWLRHLGVKLSIDDFGTGNSGLARLRSCPIDTLKIDRSFVSEVGSEHDRAPLLAAMIGLAHDLGLSVVAEGVETAEQGAFLRRRGCDLAQGYYFSKPVSAKEIPALFHRH